MARLGLLTALLVLCHNTNALDSQGSSPAPLPSEEISARAPNSFRIFNAVHSALRQWGSSIQHNGLSFFPVTIPEGNLFYHGRHSPDRPDTPEWLAFEMEHASQFAQCFEFDDPNDDDPDPEPDWESNLEADSEPAPLTYPLKCFRKFVHGWSSMHGKMGLNESDIGCSPGTSQRTRTTGLFPNTNQRPLTGDGDSGGSGPRPPHTRHPLPPKMRGYLQTYRAARPLSLLYIDGMAAAKCGLGTLDSQISVLLAGRNYTDPWHHELERAFVLCDMAREWGLDGYIRMEAGFEIIYCDFSDGAGLNLVSTHGSPWRNETHNSAREGWGGEWFVMGVYEWMRASAARYGGLPRGRAVVDFSGMVSAFMYDVNTTNPDPGRPDLPRVVGASEKERVGIRERVREVVRDRQGKSAQSLDWQAVVDNIVTRFATRLWYMAEGDLSARLFRSQLATILYPFLNYPDDESLDDFDGPLERCTDIYLSTFAEDDPAWTPEDRAIYAAIHTVSHTICSTLFAMRKEAHKTDGTPSGEEAAAERATALVRELVAQLNWTTWKECGKCADPEEMCFVPMFPAGEAEDFFHPSCKTQNDISFGYFMGPGWGDGGGNETELDTLGSSRWRGRRQIWHDYEVLSSLVETSK